MYKKTERLVSMFLNVAFDVECRNNDRGSNIENLSVPIQINCCGFYRVDSDPGITTFHPDGRRDYQLLYIASGRGHFKFGDVWHTVTKGNMILFRPKDAMNYYYRKEDKTDVYWVHFTGSDASSLSSLLNVPEDKNIFFSGVSPDYSRIYEQLIRELQLKRTNYKEMLSLLLRQLFILTNRYSREDCLQGIDVANEIEKAIHYFNENYTSNISVEDYASKHAISKNWFIHCFKKIMKVTPMQYVISLRISSAKNLLENTDKSITEIAAATGFENPLYFSRLFKKSTGFSPSSYRKHIISEISGIFNK